MALTSPIINSRSIEAYSLIDIAKQKDPNGGYLKVAEVLNETNNILQDIPFVEANGTFSHVFGVRTSLPEAYIAEFNAGTPASKTEIATMAENAMRIEARSIIDQRLKEATEMDAQQKFLKDSVYIEALNQAMTENLFYGRIKRDKNGIKIQTGAKLPSTIDGLAYRYNTVDLKKSDLAKNVIDCGGTGNNLTSIWLIGWSPNTVYGFYPKGSKGGLNVDYHPGQRVLDPHGNPFYADETIYSWSLGLAIEDWRYVVRICNIDVDQLTTQFNGLASGDYDKQNNLLSLLNRARSKIPSSAGKRLAFYMNSDVHALLSDISLRSNKPVLTFEQGSDKYGTNDDWLSFMRIPLKRVDKLTNEEDQVQ